MEPSERVYNAWVVVRPAEDLDEEWVAHVLDFDIVTQGNSIEHAIQMAVEATQTLVVDDLRAGEDPTLRRAPEECWQSLWDTIKHGVPIDWSDADLKLKSRALVRSVAVQMVMLFKTVPTSARTAAAAKPNWNAPLAFASNDGAAAAHC